MSDRLHVNHSSHCNMCTPGMRNQIRAHLGSVDEPGPRTAVCPVHDVAGPVDLLPPGLQLAMRQHRA